MRTATRLFLVALVALVLATGCGPRARLVRSWSDPGRTNDPVQDILVIGISRDENALRLWENIFIETLASRHTRARAGHTVIGPLPEPDRRAVVEAIGKTGAAAVLITRLADISTETITHPGTVHFEPRAIYRSMYGYYGTAYRAVFMPPVDVTRTRVCLESNLYEAASGRLLWSARTEAMNPKLLRSDYQRLISLLVDDMATSGLLP